MLKLSSLPSFGLRNKIPLLFFNEIGKQLVWLVNENKSEKGTKIGSCKTSMNRITRSEAGPHFEFKLALLQQDRIGMETFNFNISLFSFNFYSPRDEENPCLIKLSLEYLLVRVQLMVRAQRASV